LQLEINLCGKIQNQGEITRGNEIKVNRNVTADIMQGGRSLNTVLRHLEKKK
jgi:hypothetical protein